MIHPKFSNELEQRVLENLMHLEKSDNIRVQHAMLKLSNDCFYKPDNASLYGYIREAFKNQETFNFVDILVKLGQNNDLHSSLTAIMNNYRTMHVSDTIFEYDIDKLIALRNLRKQLKMIDSMITEINHCPEPFEAQRLMFEKIKPIATYSHQESKHGISNIEIAEMYYDGELCEEQKIATTCEQLNEALSGGIMPASLIILAAGASVGKTGFSIFMMDSIARAQPGSQTLFFSIEMKYRHIWSRHVGISAGKQFEKLDKDERLAAVSKSLAVPMKIYDTEMCPRVSDIDFILTTARLRAMESPISVIVVDYLGLVQNHGHFERNDLKQSDITGKLAQLAIELNCTVIALSQINRGAANRSVEDRCPWPHDAADSSGGHRSASLWFGVDRPELYQDDPSYRNQFVVKCRKNRFGGTFELIFAFNEGTFAEVPQGYFKQPMAKTRNAEQAVFSARSNDIYTD